MQNSTSFVGTERFIVGDALGHGGMGSVYTAYDRERQVRVALKLLRNADPRTIYRFKREFRVLADVTHPNLVNLYELVCVDDNWFFTMEFVEGVDFIAHIRGTTADPVPTAVPSVPSGTNWPTSEDESANTLEFPTDKVLIYNSLVSPLCEPEQFERLTETLRQLTEGLIAIHATGHLHCDIKPQNVMVDKHGRVVVLDFGVAVHLAQSGRDGEHPFVGTPAYAAPEQFLRQTPTQSSDWYAVGTMLYQALTGTLPFSGEFASLLKMKVEASPPDPAAIAPTAPQELLCLCRDLLARDPKSRPGGAAILSALPKAPHAATASFSARRSISAGEQFVGREDVLEELALSARNANRQSAQVVVIRGRSGMGKSSLLGKLCTRSEHDGVLVLAGRCYERETLPYKALDGAIDELAQVLGSLSREKLRQILPADFALLSRLFPVLRRVASMVGVTLEQEVSPEPQEMRNRGFRALRELLGNLAAEQPVLVSIDDAQWGDLDSVKLLTEVIRSREAPPVLFVIAMRVEDSENNAFVVQMEPVFSMAAQVDLNPLTEGDSRALARSLLSGHDASDEDIDWIVGESGGNPLFVAELAMHMRSVSRGTELERPTLQRVIQERIDVLPKAARRLLEMVAVAGSPLPQGLINRAADIPSEDDASFQQLRISRLVQSGGIRLQDPVEVYNDRVRETVVSALDPKRLRHSHSRLVAALEASGNADPETLSRHHESAGNFRRAGRYAALAGDAAAAGLAFTRAAEQYQRALRLSKPKPDRAVALLTKLGDALGNAGAGQDAAHAYLNAAQHATPELTTTLRATAARHLLYCGHLHAGIETLRDTLRSVGMHLPRHSWYYPLIILLRRVRLRLGRHHFRERPANQIEPLVLRRIDACWAAASGLAVIDLLGASDFQARHQLLALRAGEVRRVAQALLSEVYYAGSFPQARRRVAALLPRIRRLVAELDDVPLQGLQLVIEAWCAYQRLDFASALSTASRAVTLLRDNAHGVYWELGTSQLVRLWSLYYLGRIHELSRELPTLLLEARERGDIFTQANLQMTVLNAHWLAADNLAQAREAIRAAMAHWPDDLGFSLQHYWEFIARVQAELYAGDGNAAWTLIENSWRPLRSSYLMMIALVRDEVMCLRGRAALAAASVDVTRRSSLLRHAAKAARQLQSSPLPWGAGLGALLAAGVARSRGDSKLAAELFREAATALCKLGMSNHEAAARYHAGDLVAGEEGAAAMRDAAMHIRDAGIANPERFINMLAPNPALPNQNPSGDS